MNPVASLPGVRGPPGRPARAGRRSAGIRPGTCVGVLRAQRRRQDHAAARHARPDSARGRAASAWAETTPAACRARGERAHGLSAAGTAGGLGRLRPRASPPWAPSRARPPEAKARARHALERVGMAGPWPTRGVLEMSGDERPRVLRPGSSAGRRRCWSLDAQRRSSGKPAGPRGPADDPWTMLQPRSAEGRAVIVSPYDPSPGPPPVAMPRRGRGRRGCPTDACSRGGLPSAQERARRVLPPGGRVDGARVPVRCSPGRRSHGHSPPGLRRRIGVGHVAVAAALQVRGQGEGGRSAVQRAR